MGNEIQLACDLFRAGFDPSVSGAELLHVIQIDVLFQEAVSVCQRDQTQAEGGFRLASAPHIESVTGHFFLLILLHYLSEITAYLQGQLCALLVIRKEEKQGLLCSDHLITSVLRCVFLCKRASDVFDLD